jgi:hypothetical protein
VRLVTRLFVLVLASAVGTVQVGLDACVMTCQTAPAASQSSDGGDHSCHHAGAATSAAPHQMHGSTLPHHTFDSTHIAYGIVTAAVDHGPWIVEGSLFNGREPDENRWDFDFGALDSVSGRVWYRPNAEWEFQASTGHLTNPEELHPGTSSARPHRPRGRAFQEAISAR